MSINKLATETERFFNIMDSVPALAIPCSAVRTALAVGQFATASFSTAAGTVGSLVAPDFFLCKNAKKHGPEHMYHGALNVIRGVGELLLGFTGIGSGILFIYQLCSGRNFAPIVAYAN